MDDIQKGITIIIDEGPVRVFDGGNTFEGNFIHWQDTFYSFSEQEQDLGSRLESIVAFCADMKWDVTIRYIYSA